MLTPLIVNILKVPEIIYHSAREGVRLEAGLCINLAGRGYEI